MDRACCEINTSVWKSSIYYSDRHRRWEEMKWRRTNLVHTININTWNSALQGGVLDWVWMSACKIFVLLSPNWKIHGGRLILHNKIVTFINLSWFSDFNQLCILLIPQPNKVHHCAPELRQSRCFIICNWLLNLATFLSTHAYDLPFSHSVSFFLDPMGEEYHIRRASWIPALMVVVGIDPVTQHLWWCVCASR